MTCSRGLALVWAASMVVGTLLVADTAQAGRRHVSLGNFRFDVDQNGAAGPAELVFTENETNTRRLFKFEDGNAEGIGGARQLIK